MTNSSIISKIWNLNSPSGTAIEVQFKKDTVWLTQAQMVELFDSSKANISEHIKHIYNNNELAEGATVRKFRTVQTEELAFNPTIRKFRIVRQGGAEISVRREEESTCSILELVCKESLRTTPHGAIAGKNLTKNPKRLIISILNRNTQ